MKKKHRFIKGIIFILFCFVIAAGAYYLLMKYVLIYGKWDVDCAVRYDRTEGIQPIESLQENLFLDNSVFTFSIDHSFEIEHDGQSRRGTFKNQDGTLLLTDAEGNLQIGFTYKRTRKEMIWRISEAEGIPEEEAGDYLICLVPHRKEKKNRTDSTQTEYNSEFYKNVIAVDPDESAGEFTYEVLADNTVKITGITEEKEKWQTLDEGAVMNDVFIPDYIGGRPVSQLGADTFQNGDYLVNVTIRLPRYLTYLEGNPFNGCNSVGRIVIAPETQRYGMVGTDLIDFEEHRLVMCIPKTYSLDKYKLPYDIISIEEHAFEQVSSINNMILSDRLISIGDYAFSKTKIEKMTMPETLHSIGEHAFASVSEAISLPDNIEYIGDNAFRRTEVELNNSNRYYQIIDDMLIDKENASVIGYMTGRTPSLTIPAGILTIVDQAFKGADIRELYFNDELTSIGKETFSDNYNLRELKLPSALMDIGSGAFRNCNHLERVYFPENVSSVAMDAFKGCTKLQEFNVAEGNKSFYAEDGLLISQKDHRLLFYPLGKTETEYVIPQSVEIVGEHAFSGCSSLETIRVPQNVRVIENEAFYPCPSLKIVSLSEGLHSIGDRVFDCQSKYFNMKVPKSLESVGENYIVYNMPNDSYLDEYFESAGQHRFIVYLYRNSEAEPFLKEQNLPYIIYPEQSVSEYFQEAYSTMEALAKNNDYEAFANYCEQFETDPERISMYFDMIQMLQSYTYHILIPTDATCEKGFGNIVTYISPEEENETWIGAPISMGAVNVNGDWQLCEQDSGLRNSFFEKYSPDRANDAWDAGRHYSRLNTDIGWIWSDAEYSGIYKQRGIMVWQNEDGSVEVLIACSNGTDEDRSIGEVHVWMEDDRIGTIFDVQAETDKIIPAGKNMLMTLTIPSEQILTGTQRWERFSFHVENEYVKEVNAFVTDLSYPPQEINEDELSDEIEVEAGEE